MRVRDPKTNNSPAGPRLMLQKIEYCPASSGQIGLGLDHDFPQSSDWQNIGVKALIPNLLCDM